MNAATREEMFRRLQAADPAPTTELVYASHFELLVAVILSAQATDKSVNQATKKLFAVANTPQAILAELKALDNESAELLNSILKLI